jgi:hypothetical protein
MKLPIICALCFASTACAMNSPAPVDVQTPASLSTVQDIQDSCNDDNTTQTVINGHAYFCMDYATFVQKMQQLQQRMGY